MNVGNLIITLGIVFIIIYGSTQFYTSLNVATGNTEFLNMSGYNSYDEYNSLYGTEYTAISSNSSSFTTSSAGDLIFGAGYTTLRGIFTGSWLVITSNILLTSVGIAPIDPVFIGIIITIISICFLLVMLGAIMGRNLIGR
jgi:hypothetical protein